MHSVLFPNLDPNLRGDSPFDEHSSASIYEGDLGLAGVEAKRSTWVLLRPSSRKKQIDCLLPNRSVGQQGINNARHCGGFTILESVMGMAIVSLLLGCVFTMNAQVLKILKHGKESTYATQMLQERVEQLRTAPWEVLTSPEGLSFVAHDATATAINFPGVTENITVEPLVNPTNIRAVCMRNSSGAVTTAGVSVSAQKSVKVNVSVLWTSQRRTRVRSMTTVMTAGGI